MGLLAGGRAPLQGAGLGDRVTLLHGCLLLLGPVGSPGHVLLMLIAET